MNKRYEIKLLEWDDYDVNYAIARTSFGHYWIEWDDEEKVMGYHWAFVQQDSYHVESGTAFTIEEAKKACQCDLERMLKSHLQEVE